MYSRLFMVLLQYIWLNLWNRTFQHVLCLPSQLHFSRYLPSEQRHMVTAVSTRLRQFCGTTYHSSSKLWTWYQLLNRVSKYIFLNKLFVCTYSIWHRLFLTVICICRLLLMILWYLPYLDPLTFSFLPLLYHLSQLTSASTSLYHLCTYHKPVTL